MHPDELYRANALRRKQTIDDLANVIWLTGDQLTTFAFIFAVVYVLWG